MPYIGRVVQKSADIRRQTITGSTSATHTLTSAPSSEQQLLITINGLKQHDAAFTVSGTTLTLAAALVATDEMEIVTFVDVGATVSPGDGTVTSAKLDSSIDNAITANTAKVTNATHTGDVTGSTALTIATDAVDIAMLSATGTADATTFLRGDNAWATPSGGKILQVVHANYATQVSTGTTPISTGTTATITPASASNKIIVFATINGLQKDGTNTNGRMNLKVDRDGSLVHNVQAIMWNYIARAFRDGGYSILYVDSPSSTSAVVYTITFSGSDVVACYVNKDSNSGPSYITLMEIA